MAKHMLYDASIVINGVDLSDHVRSVTVNQTREDLDVTAMGATGHQRIAGLGDDSFDVEFWADFAASKVDATLAPLVGAAAFTVVVKPTSAAVSATNPSFTGSCILTEYTPIAGSVGDAHAVSVSLPVSGVISRATS